MLRPLPLLVFALGLGGCGRGAVPEPVAPPPARLFLAVARDGKSLRLRDAEATAPLAAIGAHDRTVHAPAVDAAGRHCCFLAREADVSAWGLFVAPLGPGSDVGAAVRLEADVDGESAPAWMPDGRIVISSPRAGMARALYVVSATRGGSSAGTPAPARITFSGTDARDPCVLRDGRVLYVGSLGDESSGEEGPTRRPALFAVQADGTGALLFHAATPGARYARPREGPDGTVVFLAGDHASLRAWAIDPRAPQAAARSLAAGQPVTCIEPDGRGRWLVLDGRGVTRSVADDGVAAGPGWPPLADLCGARARVRPQGHAGRLDPHGTTGLLLCMDARDGVPAGAQFAALHARSDGAADWRALGRVPLEDDGSFFAKVPADTPLRVDVLDAAGRVLGGSRTPFWVRSGEVRGCVGCHDAPDLTPPNRRPLAVLKTPAVPRPAGKEGS